MSRPFWDYQWRFDAFNSSYAEATFGMDDIERIRSLGFRHVRLPLAEKDLFHEESPEVLHNGIVAALSTSIARAVDQDLAVILDWHPDDAFQARLQESDAFVAKLNSSGVLSSGVSWFGTRICVCDSRIHEKYWKWSGILTITPINCLSAGALR